MHKAEFYCVGAVYKEWETHSSYSSLLKISTYKLLVKVIVLFQTLVAVLKVNSLQKFVWYIYFQVIILLNQSNILKCNFWVFKL